MISEPTPRDWWAWLPSRGNVLFTLFALAALIFAGKTGAISLTPNTPQTPAVASASTIPYQGRLTSASGAPLNGQVDLTFTLYTVPTGGSALWDEHWTNVTVTEGLFNVLLGSTKPIGASVLANSSLWLGIAVEADSEMTPRVQLGAAPFAMTVPDGSITAAKLAGNVLNVSQDTKTAESNTTGSTAYQDQNTVTKTTAGGSVFMVATFGCVQTGPTGSFHARLVIDGTEKISTGGLYNRAWSSCSLSWFEQNVSSGEHVFKLQYRTDIAGETAYIQNANLVVIELK